MKIKLEEGQTGYDVIGEYIERFWKFYEYPDTVICQIGTSYDGINYHYHNEIVSPCCYNDIEFLYDWQESEKFLGLNGICYLKDIKSYEEIFNEVGIEITCDTCVNRGKYGFCTLKSGKPCFEYEAWERKE